ncbi:MAG: hypothetical protein P4L40_13210 [Terracidiphilus sp.]|nr:hypothetical protein [Terracidiphilus sp.]
MTSVVMPRPIATARKVVIIDAEMHIMNHEFLSDVVKHLADPATLRLDRPVVFRNRLTRAWTARSLCQLSHGHWPAPLFSTCVQSGNSQSLCARPGTSIRATMQPQSEQARGAGKWR